MAVELMNPYRTTGAGAKMEEVAVREAGAAGIQSLHNLIASLSTPSHRKPPYSVATNNNSTTTDYAAVADIAVSKFKKFITLLDRTSTGHARFRRGPVLVSNPPVITQKKPTISAATVSSTAPVPTTINFAVSGASPATSFMSSLTGDTEGLQPSMSSGFQITNLSQASSVGRPNVSSSSFKRKCDSIDDSHTKCTSSSGRCHCSKKKKLKVKRIVRVPAISLKMADIPPDDYSWRKYGQKPIKGSPHPRGYYKCSSLKGCPARKHVEKALDDPSMLIVTYESEHNHSLDLKDSPATIIFESS